MPSTNLYHYESLISTDERTDRNGHEGAVLWFTGLSGSGKSTLAHYLEKILFVNSLQTYVLDGDNIRSGINSDLDFSESGRKENIRRIGEIAHLFKNAGLITITSFISPFRQDRSLVREINGNESFIEVFVKCSLKTCEKRDVKGLYQKARKGEISHFTGIDSPYEEPENPEITVNTELNTPYENLKHITDYLYQNKIIRQPVRDDFSDPFLLKSIRGESV